MEKLKYKLTTPQLMWAIVLAGGVVLALAVPKGKLFDSGWWGIAVLALGVINWIAVARAAGHIHRQALRSVQGIDHIVTEGMYGVVRHPMYAAGMMAAWSIFIWQPYYRVLAVVMWATVVLLFWSNLEDRMLEEKFMEEYREYKKRVPMIVPRIGGIVNR